MRSTDARIDAIFRNLNKWREFPCYQLERRLDIFLSIYLKDILEYALGVQLKNWVIPEFPIRHKLTGTSGRQGENQSWKVDYIAQSDDSNTLFLIELKTDMGSRNTNQDYKMRRVADRGDGAAYSLEDLIWGVLQIFEATKSKRKYINLFKEMRDIGLIELDPDVDEIVERESVSRKEMKAAVRKTDILSSAKSQKVHIVYIQPDADDESPYKAGNKSSASADPTISVVGFGKVSEFLKGKSDDDRIAFHLAESLEQWHKNPV